MTGASGRGPRRAALAGAAAIFAIVLAGAPACGKKGPLRLPDQRPPEHADTPRAAVSGGRLTLSFKVPAHRVFPEREEPWVLARILRREASGKEFVEVGTILEGRGFGFGEPLAWSEEAQTAGTSAYRVEFRDGARRRRALSNPVEVIWQVPPDAPTALTATGDDKGVELTWKGPAGATGAIRYRIYRRQTGGGEAENLTPDPVPAERHTDTRVVASRVYCYVVRAVLGAPAVEGPAGPEVCVRTEDATPPPAPARVRVIATPGGFQLTWEEVPAEDLLGYRVYRGVGDGPLALITPNPVQGNAFREETREAPAGTRYRYVVTAVDNSSRRNESPFSPPAEASAIPPPDGP